MSKVSKFTRFRQLLLFYLLLMVGVSAWLSNKRSTDWNKPLWVAVYPINGDQSKSAAQYISSLDDGDFSAVEDFFTRQSIHYHLDLNPPVTLHLMNEVRELPPPTPASNNVLAIMSWSLKVRYWAWQQERQQDAVRADIKMFVVYFDPEQHPSLEHSLGLRKGLVGIVNAFASKQQRGSNQVVLAHELMHTLGATDKYDLSTSLPQHPEGFASPDKQPLYPQKQAEIMGGRIPISENEAHIPSSLKQVVVGEKTAIEINWLER